MESGVSRCYRFRTSLGGCKHPQKNAHTKKIKNLQGGAPSSFKYSYESLRSRVKLHPSYPLIFGHLYPGYLPTRYPQCLGRT